MANLIGYGSSGDSVTELQNKLRAAGYNISADGVFGNETKAAVEAYQKANGLGVDGIVGSQTGGSLGLSGYSGGTASTASNSSGIPLWTVNNNYSNGGSVVSPSAGGVTSVGSGDLSGYLKSQYASALEAELAGIKNAYQLSTSTLDRTAQEIPELYEVKRNATAATNALDKRAFDERANAMGLNTGTSGQAQLSRASMYQRDLAGLSAEEANALADLSLQRSQRQAEYEMALVQAKAENDAALNAALYAEMVRQINAAPKYSSGGGSYGSSGGSGGSDEYIVYGGTTPAPTLTTDKSKESAKGGGTTSFSNVQRTINAALQTGETQRAASLIEGVWGQLSDAQKQTLATTAKQNGLTLSY